jgi:hypothetical protein
MRNSSVLILKLAVVLVATQFASGAGVEGRGAEALTKGEEVFSALSTPNPENESRWGLTDLRVFGRDTRFGVMGAGDARVAVQPDAPDSYEVTIPFWCAGKTPQGDSVKRKGEFAVRVHATAGSGWEVVKSGFHEQESLSFWRQLLAWIGWTFLGGIILNLGAAILGAMTDSQKTCFTWAAVCSIVLCGYVASVLFGSALAVTVCVLLGLLGAVGRIKALNVT